jgi:2-C-methyl-D-erythritol 2,4-cyclodiphosphate synthase
MISDESEAFKSIQMPAQRRHFCLMKTAVDRRLSLPKIFMSFRIGQGVDFHQLAEGRELWIGGVKVEHSKGSVGHSDADVLLHAICDGMLGAACLGDIGTHFPDTDQQYKNIDSKILLQRTVDLVKKQGYALVNIDSTLCLEKPKIKPYVPQMQQTIAAICGLQTTDVSIKATTTEQMGFVGREEGLVAYASVLLQRI